VKLTKHFLERQYIRKSRTIKEIARAVGVDPGTVRNRMITFGISRRRKGWHRVVNLAGRTFGKLTVTRMFGTNGKRVLWEAECECGNRRAFQSDNLLSGHSKSCGCIGRATGKHSFNWAGYGDISGFMWNKMKRNAADKGRRFTISIRSAWRLFLLQGRKCALSGAQLHFASSTKFHSNGVTTASLDRIDSSKGYTKGNVQWIHKSINQMKSDLPQRLFIDMCLAVASKQSD
jgi:hypothetical protein